MTPRTLVPVLALFGVLATPPLAAQPSAAWFEPTRVDDAPLIETVRTEHAGTFNGQDIRFDVVAGETLLTDEEGQPAATVFTTAYLRTDTGEGEQRPVLFLFNGGPGASSSPLHLGVGPVRAPKGDPDGALVPNPLSPLDAVDLVFVDPVGTGYTRLYQEGAGAAYWGIQQDADAMLQLLGEWLARNGRTGSPVFLMGESYGGMRVVAMAARAGEQPLSGLLLLSPALDITGNSPVVGNNLPYIALLPNLAATAVFHGVVDRAGRSDAEVFEQASDFATGDYAAALYRGNTLSAEKKAQTVDRLAALTGLDRDWLLESKLRIERNAFADALLPGRRVGRLDARITGPLEDYRDQRPPGDDPSMAPRREGRSTGELLDEYFSGPLQVEAGHPYRTLNLHLNGQWNWGLENTFNPYLSVVPQLQAAMDADPELDVWIGGGFFDLVTPIMSARYAASQVDADADRFILRGFEGGHATFEHEDSRRAIGEDIRAFVSARSGRGTP